MKFYAVASGPYQGWEPGQNDHWYGPRCQAFRSLADAERLLDDIRQLNAAINPQCEPVKCGPITEIEVPLAED